MILVKMMLKIKIAFVKQEDGRFGYDLTTEGVVWKEISNFTSWLSELLNTKIVHMSGSFAEEINISIEDEGEYKTSVSYGKSDCLAYLEMVQRIAGRLRFSPQGFGK